MTVAIACVRSAIRPSRRPQERLRRGFIGALHSARILVTLGVSPRTGRQYPSVQAVWDAVDLQLQRAVLVAMMHPTERTLGEAFDAIDTVTALMRSASRSIAAACPVEIARLSLATSGLRSGLDEVEQGLETIELSPSWAPEHPQAE